MSWQYVLPLVRFLSQNLEIYTFNATVLDFNTKNKLLLHKPSTTLTIYQKGAYNDSIKTLNELIKYIAESVLRKKKCFIINLKKCLTGKTFYSIEEYMNS